MELMSTDQKKRRITIAVAGALLVLALTVTLALLFTAKPGPKEVAEDYLGALQAHDYAKAYELLSAGAQKSVVEPAGLEQTSTGALFAKGLATGFTLREVSKDKNRAVLEATFTVNGSQLPVKMTAVKEKGCWRIEL